MNWQISVQETTVACALIGASVAFIQQRNQPNDQHLEKVMAKLLAASSIPTGLLILASAFHTEWLSKLSDLGIYLAAAGVALLYVSVKELIKR
jgi:hypothetical protein